MQKSLLLFPLLFAFSTATYAGDELLFECVSDKNTHLRLAANQHQNGEITFDFKQANISQQSEMTFSSPLDEAYLYQYLNGTQLRYPITIVGTFLKKVTQQQGSPMLSYIFVHSKRGN